jgi:hypothetical protein
MRLAAVVFLVLAAGVARAEVDWRAGRVTAAGVGAADLRAPGPDIARAGAERVAEEQWKKELLAELRGLRLAGGGTLGKRADEDATAAAALSALVDGAEVEKSLYSDGSVVVSAWVSLDEAARVAGLGPEARPDEAGPLLVDARRLELRPALGYRVKVGGAERPVAARFTHEAPERFGARATAVKGGVVTVDGELLGQVVVFVVKGGT